MVLVASCWVPCDGLAFYPGRSNTPTVNSLLATTCHKRPPLVSDHFVKDHFGFQSNTVLKTLVSDHCSNFSSNRDHFLGQKFDTLFCFLFPVSDHPR